MSISRGDAHPFTIRQAQYALAVEETGGFRRAAERCHVSQPALSTQIAQLEGALDVQIFERSRRRVLVTEQGRALLERLRAFVAAGDDVRAFAAALGDPLAGPLRLGVIPTVSPYLLPDLSSALRKRCPRLDASWIEDKTHALVARVQSGELDGALLAAEADLGSLAVEDVAKDPFVLVTRPDHPLARSRGARIEELAATEVLLLDEGHCLREQALSLCGREARGPDPFRATSLTTLVQLVIQRGGATLLPELALSVENRRGELHVRRFVRPSPTRTLVVAHRKGSPRLPALLAVVAAARAAYRSVA